MHNPAINELYSNGLQQGVSGIEEDNPNLENEGSAKLSAEYSLKVDQPLRWKC